MEKTDFEKMSNEELCVYVRKNAFAGWNILIERNRSFFHKIARNVIRDAQIINDDSMDYLTEILLDEVTESIYEAVQQFDQERGFRFLTLAGRILYNRMMTALGTFYKPREISMEEICYSLQERYGEEIQEYEISIGNQTESEVIRKIYFEQFRDCFLHLEDAQQMVLSYKFGYDPYQPVLSCKADYKTDRDVAKYYHSKTSVIKGIRIRGFQQIRETFL